MKRFFMLAVTFLLVTTVLSGCIFSPVLFIPSNDDIGNAQHFEADGIKLLLTDAFTKTESEYGFDAYYTSKFCGVTVLKEEFTLKLGFEDETIVQYIEAVIKNNGHTNTKYETKDGLYYYTKESNGNTVYSFAYKGSDAFYIVQYIIRSSDVNALKDTIFMWAASVEVK